MKNIFVLILMCITTQLPGQTITGNYYDYFGHKLELKADSTFKHTWHFDLISSWTTGTWRIQNDTLFLETVLIYDTLKIDRNGMELDTFILSSDETSEVIKWDEYFISQLSTGGQNRSPIPNKLYLRKKRLYLMDEKGKLITKRSRGFWSGKKFPPYYVRPKNE
ncbi:MAG: hypothetical protein AAGI38_05625 [Bacteroidota bacterium]